VDDAALRGLIAGGETAHVECKVAPPRVSDLAARLCGFANGEGGHLILGVADRTWAVVGVADAAAAIDVVLQACRQCKPPVTLVPPAPAVVSLDGMTLVIASIPPNDGTLHQAAGVFFIRRGTHTVPLDAAEIERYFHARGTLAWEARPVSLATLADLEPERVRAYLANRPGRRTRETDGADPVTLQRIGCAAADLRDPAMLRPTHAGLLLFGRAPQDVIGHAEIVCALFGDELGLRRYLDRRLLHGTLPEQIDQAEEFLTRHMRVGARTAGFHDALVAQGTLRAVGQGRGRKYVR
jgi:ATP-dependent DNA helicase RecG